MADEGSLLGSSLTDSWIGLPITAAGMRDRVRSWVTADDEAAEPSSPAPMPEPQDDRDGRRRNGGDAEKAAEEATWRAATAATVAAEAEDAAALALEALTQVERNARAAEQRAGSAVDSSLELQADAAAAAAAARLIRWLQTDRHANAVLLAVDCLAHKTLDELAALGIDHETALSLREARAMVAESGTETRLADGVSSEALPRPATPTSGATSGRPDDVPVVVAVPVSERSAHRYINYMYIAGGVALLLAALRALNRHRNPDPTWQEAHRAVQEAREATRRAEQAQRSAKVGGASAAIGATVGTMLGGPMGTVIGGVVGGAIGGLY